MSRGPAVAHEPLLLCLGGALAAPISFNKGLDALNQVRSPAQYYYLDCEDQVGYDSCNATSTNGGVTCNYDGSFLSHGVVPFECRRQCRCAPVPCSSYCGETERLKRKVVKWIAPAFEKVVENSKFKEGIVENVLISIY